MSLRNRPQDCVAHRLGLHTSRVLRLHTKTCIWLCGCAASQARRRLRRGRSLQASKPVLPKISGTSSSLKSSVLTTGRAKDQPVTLQLKQGPNVQALKLPTDKLEPNKKYYVTFTLKPKDSTSSRQQFDHRHRQSVY